MTQPDLARLEGLLTRLRTMGCYGHKSYPTHFINPDGAEAATEIEALLARVRESEKRNRGLVDALEPFAKCAEAYTSFDGQHDFDDDFVVANCSFQKITVGKFRDAQIAIARAALTLNKDNPDAG